jgi:hypothetical protein
LQIYDFLSEHWRTWQNLLPQVTVKARSDEAVSPAPRKRRHPEDDDDVLVRDVSGAVPAPAKKLKAAKAAHSSESSVLETATLKGELCCFQTLPIFLFFIRVARWFIFKPRIPIWVKF